MGSAAGLRNNEPPRSRRSGRPTTDLAGRSRTGGSHPVFFGSALTGDGVEELMAGIAELLPAPAATPTAPLSGTVFKIERGPAGREDRLRPALRGHGPHARPRALRRDARQGHGARGLRPAATPCSARGRRPGEIAKLWGLGEFADRRLARRRRARPPPSLQFAPPTLESVVAPADRDGGAARRARRNWPSRTR